jgi:hypothetical protein
MDFSRQLWEQQRSVFLQCTQSLVLTQEAIIAIGTDGPCCTHLKEKQHSQQNTNRAFKNGLFSANLGAKMTSLFAMYTM